MKKTLVIGGAGFIGSHTVDFLLEKNNEVLVLDNLVTGSLENLNVSHPNLKFIKEDVLHYTPLKNIIAECDAVLHLAALPSVTKSIEDPINSLKMNTLSFLHVLEAIRELKHPIRLVYASSAAVYGKNAQLPCDESIALNNGILSPYALEKANNERYAALYANLFNVKSLGLRYFNVYGDRQDSNSPYSGVISKFLHLYKENLPLSVFGEGEQSRDFIHVVDVVRANYLALTNNYCGVLNIATGIPQTINYLIQCIQSIGRRPAIVHYSPSQLGDIRESYASVKLAEEVLGFSSSINLTMGIRSLMEKIDLTI